ncbi:DUF5787 family protein [Halobacteriaceae archaeon GCM10025711]
MAPDSEFDFELRVCAWAEREWPPDGALDSSTAVVVARQLGTRRRRWDTIVLEVDRVGLSRRARFGAERLDSDLLHVVRNAPADWAWYRDALPDPGYPWRYVREAIHRASDRGVIDTRRDGNRIEIRRKWEYPDWVNRVVAVENKPNLDASAARALAEQVEHDVAMALADEVWVATAATGDRIEPILLEDLPVEAGIVTLDFDADDPASVRWYPRTLAVDDPGTNILERPDGGEYDLSAARFEYVDPAEKERQRLRIAERAYERGWRSYADTMRPDCRHYHLRRANGDLLPYCAAKERTQTASECAGSCPSFEPEPPPWRSRGWPIAGGPGKRVKQVLDERRQRQR